MRRVDYAAVAHEIPYSASDLLGDRVLKPSFTPLSIFPFIHRLSPSVTSLDFMRRFSKQHL